MNLFESMINPSKNLLPKHGIVNFYGKILSLKESNKYFSHLLKEVNWKNDQAIIYGKKIITKRMVAWYGDKPFKYRYSNTIKTALPWIDKLKELKHLVEQKTNETYNSCLLNLYHNGEEGMAWHSDAEKDLKQNGAIASLSFGVERKFCFKHKCDKQVISLNLAHGSLLIMKDVTQTYWLHRLPPSKKIKEIRINLTFRTIVES
ncbi:MAG: alpha-ketoglutarate-dependent dioxygenase AlkB [Candidatus Cloacimonadota bacterium]|nr:MAG: alpha-ketoglutarate-dependent dioxygenase AlkB [Candidatus Cloacimonadota bacterium]